MKIYLLFAGAALLLSSCNRKELADTNRANDSLLTVVSERESALNEFISSFNEVERNLDSVSVRQHIITMNTDGKGELKLDQKARLNNDIAAINDLMEENRKKINALNSKLKASSARNSTLEKTLATLSAQLNQKNTELEYLNAQLTTLDAKVAQLETNVSALTAVNGEQSKTIENETTALHSAYYVIGKSSELQEKEIIDRKGGLLGIGKTSQLRADFDNKKFTRIDYTQTENIAVNSGIKIITSHPSDSYRLEKDSKHKDMVKNIVITNPEKFWSASKYLVVIKN
jgi:uncharacterized coiled-coil protein SlyX